MSVSSGLSPLQRSIKANTISLKLEDHHVIYKRKVQKTEAMTACEIALRRITSRTPQERWK